MIRPSQTSNLLIDVTNACHLHCSNCTRLLDHAKTRYFMSPACFEQALQAVADFVTHVDPHPVYGMARRRVIGIMGGEPLLHPQFPELVDLAIQYIPQVYHRGLWTSKDWTTDRHPKWGSHRVQVERLLGPRPTRDGAGPSARHACGYLCWNMHLDEAKNHHQPILVASSEAVPDPVKRWALIEDCWVNREWGSAVTPKGFFFCEVAAHLDMVFQGPGGLPLEPGVWRGALAFETGRDGVRQPVGKFADQIRQSCERCGACLPLPGRRDNENVDDVSPLNLIALRDVQSPRVRRGEIVEHTFDESPYDDRAHRKGWRPEIFVKGGNQHQELKRLLTERGIS